MRELIELRAELAAERDRRYETLIAMGRQWKEDVLVEVHRRDAALHSDVSAVEEKMAAQWKESNEGRLVMQRQLEKAMRAGKVRDTSQFQLREEMQETARQLEERVDVAMSQSSAARADCSRQLEQERTSLSQRLDAELLRLVEMRRDDQRALRQAKELIREEGLKVRGEIRRTVQEVWEASASSLMKTATEPLEQLRAELRQTKAATHAMEERVADCVRTCQAECRMITTTTTERLHALESKEAVATSSIDRAERKADSAYETVRHIEATIVAANEATERAIVQVAGASERTLKVEHALTDRDNRLVAVEAQLHAIATAEGLRAEVEACKRQAGRLESHIEAAGAICTRVEKLADRSAQQVMSFANRIDSCERSTQRGVDAVQRVQEGLEACKSESQQMRTHFDTNEAALQRHTHLFAQLEQRVAGQENRLGLWRQQQEQYVKDQMTVQRELAERAEVTHNVASRAQQVSSDARAEVHRLERRLDDTDRSLTSISAETTTLRGSIDSQRTQALEVERRQKQQVADELRSLESRLEAQMAPVKKLERKSTELMELAEAQTQDLRKKLVECEEHLHEMGARVQDYLKDAVQHHVSVVQKRLFTALNESVSGVTERVAAVEEATEKSQQRMADVPQQLATMQQASAKLQLQVKVLEASLQSLSSQAQELAAHADTQAGNCQCLGTMQQEVMRLTAVQQRTQQDMKLFQEAIRALQTMVTGGSIGERSLSELGMSQARTASTDMVPVAEAISSSPSAHQPNSSGVRTSLHTSVVGTPAQPQPQRTAAVAAPPLANISRASLQELQDRQRASSGSRSSSSKEGSGERQALHLSGVSSVRPSGEQEERLHSLVEPADHSAASAGSDDAVEAFVDSPGAVAGLRRTSTGTASSVSVPQLATAATETVEQLSAPAQASTQASAVGTVSQCTAIREFTTITSSSSLSDSDSSEDGGEGTQERVVPARRAAPSEERADDVSSDLTTAITLTSEASPNQSSRRHNPPLSSLGQRRAVKMPAAWGLGSSGSSEEGAPASRGATLAKASPSQPQQPPFLSKGELKSASQRAESMDSSDDRVQAMSQHNSDTEGVKLATAAEKVSVDVEHLRATRISQAATARDFALPSYNPNWNNWNEDTEEDNGERRREKSKERGEAFEPQPFRPPGALHTAVPASENKADDAAMQVTNVNTSSDTLGSRGTSSTTPAAGPAATVLHHRQDAPDELRATPRRVFVSTSAHGRGVGTQQQAEQLSDSVPRHGRSTTSSSSSTERVEALSLRGSRQSLPQRAPTVMRQYTNFDDSTSSEDA
ncbi:hypothetical protein Q4I28_001756 [Leishmania naiffi]|uniref:Uncharacterized protein n=1 Tax=Leishmania naiffi TaxID=5678 RepID=A0AAW3C6J8_9TRYP